MRIGGSKVDLLDLIIVVLLTLVAFSYAPAQTTSVTATITDTDGQTWNNGHWSATLYNPFPANPPSINGTPLTSAQLNLSGTISSSGVLTGTFSDNSLIAPTGTQWYITICANANIQCSTGLTPITGASANLSTLFSSYTKPIRIPASWQAYMYLDSEVYPIPVPGGRYWNVTNLKLRCWNGATWQDCGSGGGSAVPGEPVDSLQFNNPDGTFAGSSSFLAHVGGQHYLEINGDSTEAYIFLDGNAENSGFDDNVSISGNRIDIENDGKDYPENIGEVAIQSTDFYQTPGFLNGLNPFFASYTVFQTGNTAIGFDSAPSTGGTAGVISGFESEGLDGDGTATKFSGFLATKVGKAPTPDEGAYRIITVAQAQILSTFCDFKSVTIDSIPRESIGCGQDSLSTFNGEVDINGQTGVAGGDALLGGTSPNSGAPPTGYVGFTGPTTVTNNYWIPIPGTFPGTINSAFSCSGTSSPLTCSWSPTVSSATAVDCLSVSCAGGSTYVNGTTYTNSLTVPVTEEVVATLTGTSGTGGQYPISATVAGSTGVAASQIANVCSGSASLSFTVPAGSTFQIPTLTPLSTCSPAGTWAISAWHEIQW